MPISQRTDHPSPSERMVIQKDKVFSFDYDGCLQDHSSKTPECAKAANSAQALFKKNIALWDFLSLTELQPSQSTVIMNGSSRQTPEWEYINAYGVCYDSSYRCNRQQSPWWPALIGLSNELNCKVDPFILEDAFSGNADNPSVLEKFSQYSEEEFKKHARAGANRVDLGDDKKIVLLYAQMHRCASMYPQSDFTFVDDRKDILRKLHSFYSENTLLIPQCVTLRLTYYSPTCKAPGPVQFQTTIKGTGTTNSQYQEVIQHLAVKHSTARKQDKWEKLLKIQHFANQEVIRHLAEKHSTARKQDEGEKLLQTQHSADQELEYQQAVCDLKNTIDKYRDADSIIQHALAAQGWEVLAAVQKNKSCVKDEILPCLIEIINKTNKGIKNPLETVDEYAQLTNKVIYRKPSIPKVIGGAMIGLIGVIVFAAGIALTASGFGAPIGIPLKIAAAFALKTAAVFVGAGLGMLVTGFASLFKRNNKTDIYKEVKAFHKQMRNTNNSPRNACAFQARQGQRNYEQNQTQEAILVTT